MRATGFVTGTVFELGVTWKKKPDILKNSSVSLIEHCYKLRMWLKNSLQTNKKLAKGRS